MLDNIESLLGKVRKIHLVGIGGISMSALAVILKKNGFEVSGSDINEGEILNKLRENNIDIYIGHSPDNINNAQMVIHTAAAKGDNLEIVAAKDRGIPVFERAQLLGALINKYNCPIGIAGTHGKTTTTSMAALIFIAAHKDPTVTVGGNLSSIGGNYRIGSDEFFIFESCEYVNSFHNFHPKISVILNIDEDHLDYFKDINDIISSFKKYVKNTKDGGTLIINTEDKNCLQLKAGYNGRLLTFGLNSGDFHAENIKAADRMPEFDVIGPEGLYAHVKLQVLGAHNIKNAIAACAAAYSAGIGGEYAAKGLYEFKGTGRRFEIIGDINGVTVIDDYAHHPTEIEATLKTAKLLQYNRVVLVFQPHTYTRTKLLFDDFVSSLSLADEVIIADIYAAREEDIYGISSENLAQKVKNGKYLGGFDEITEYLKHSLKKGDLLITMGAGDIYKIGRSFLKD